MATQITGAISAFFSRDVCLALSNCACDLTRAGSTVKSTRTADNAHRDTTAAGRATRSSHLTSSFTLDVTCWTKLAASWIESNKKIPNSSVRKLRHATCHGPYLVETTKIKMKNYLWYSFRSKHVSFCSCRSRHEVSVDLEKSHCTSGVVSLVFTF